MLVLTCLVVNDGKVFSVPMIETQMVDELKREICRKIDSSIVLKDLTLCIGKDENGQWLHLTEDDLAKLNDGDKVDAVDALMTKTPMSSTLPLNDESFGFLTDEAKQRHTIHVLMKVAAGRWTQLLSSKQAMALNEPPRVSSDSPSAIARIEQKVDEMLEATMRNKVTKYTHSHMNSKNGKELLNALNIKVEWIHVVASGPDDDCAPVPPFQWATADDGGGSSVPLTEVQQRDHYCQYINDNICEVLAQQNLYLRSVETGANVLSVRVPGHNIELSGRTDLLILDKDVEDTPDALDFLPNAKMLIEVKRAVRSGSIYQGLSELIALDLLVRGPVMALVTDLAHRWQFLWVSDKTEDGIIVQTVVIKSPGEAFRIIKAHLGNGQLPTFDRPVKKRKLETMLASISEGDGNGIGASLQQYFDVASELGPDVEMARAVAQRLVCTLPSLSMYS